jgi:hypothetical protein
MLRRLRTCIAIASVAGGAHAASPQVLQDGFENPCHTDSDRDRVANCTETALQTNAFDPDTDSDGLSDGDEVFGTRLGLDLPGLGVLPRRRDLLLEIDWVDDSTGCAFHSHRPTPGVVAGIVDAFAQVPLVNPDGSSGINLIVDHGQGPMLAGGNAIATANGTLPLEELKWIYQPVHFAVNRRGYFRYAIHAHSLGAAQNYSGVAAGDSHLVTLGCQANVAGYVRNVSVHELGHNLGLLHGGGDVCNGKPNYNSIMNYAYLFPGVDTGCDRLPDGIDKVGFSPGTRRALLKSALVEADGVCPAGHPLAQAVDWNANGAIDSQPVAVDLACPGVELIEDWDDVGRMQLALYTEPGAAEPPPVPAGEECPAPPNLGGNP